MMTKISLLVAMMFVVSLAHAVDQNKGAEEGVIKTPITLPEPRGIR